MKCIRGRLIKSGEMAVIVLGYRCSLFLRAMGFFWLCLGLGNWLVLYLRRIVLSVSSGLLFRAFFSLVAFIVLILLKILLFFRIKLYSKLSDIYVIMSAYSIGKSEKKGNNFSNPASFIQNNNVPGVGAYSTDLRITSKVSRGPTFVIGKSARLKTDKSTGPAPNVYDLSRNSFFVSPILFRLINQKAITFLPKLGNALRVKVLGQEGNTFPNIQLQRTQNINN